MDRPQLPNALAALGLGAHCGLAPARSRSCGHSRDRASRSPRQPRGQAGQAQFNSSPSPVPSGMNGPTIQGGAMARGGSAFSPGGGGVTPPAGLYGPRNAGRRAIRTCRPASAAGTGDAAPNGAAGYAPPPFPCRPAERCNPACSKILFEDAHCLAIDKPAGLLSAGPPGQRRRIAGGGRSSPSLPRRSPGSLPGDRPSPRPSGIRRDPLGEEPEGGSEAGRTVRGPRDVTKAYLAVVSGPITPDRGVWQDWLYEEETGLGVVQVCRPGTPRARRAETRYTVGRRLGDAPRRVVPGPAPADDGSDPSVAGPGRVARASDPGGCGLWIEGRVSFGDSAARPAVDATAPDHERANGPRGECAEFLVRGRCRDRTGRVRSAKSCADSPVEPAHSLKISTMRSFSVPLGTAISAISPIFLPTRPWPMGLVRRILFWS